MNASDRRQKIESYGAAYQQLAAALAALPRDMWQFRASPDGWTIHEIVVHLADSEANSYVRCRRFIAEPGGTVQGYDENQWARALGYERQNPDDAVLLFKWLRHQTYTLIRDLPASTWAHTVEHTESGTMTMDEWLDIYERHIPEHISQMQGIYDAWLRGEPARLAASQRGA